jgi:hypothetical protein
MFEDLIPELQAPARELVNACGSSGLVPKVTSTRRSHSAQARLYRRWLSGLSPLPAAPPGTSAHEFGYAFDLVVSPWEALADVGYTWESWGGVWGGDKDPVHFQYPGFLVPPIDPGAEGLPWWAAIAMPSKSVDVLATPAAKQSKSMFHEWWCGQFPNSSSCR